MEIARTNRKRGDSGSLTDPKSKIRKLKKPLSEKEKLLQEEHEEEQRLTAMIFGGGGGVSAEVAMLPKRNDIHRPESRETRTPVEKEDESGELFEIDRKGALDAAIQDDDDDDDQPATQRQIVPEAFSKALSLKSNSGSGETGAAPAWVDEEDSKLSVNLYEENRRIKLRTSAREEAASALNGVDLERRMREQYQNTTTRTARTDWAEIKDDSESQKDVVLEGGGGGVQGTSMSLLRSSGSRRLEPNKLEIVRCPDANLSDPSSSVIQAAQFHPGSDFDRPLLMTAGFDKTLRFFQVGVEGSKKIHGVHLPMFPIHSASFLGTTGNVICSSRRKYFFIYDTAAGKLEHIPRIVGREEKSLELSQASPDGRTVAFAGNDGFVILYDAHSKQWIADVKLNGNVRSLAFSPDGSYILASGSDGDVYRWDMKSKKCVERFSNVDGTPCSSLSVSSRHLAVGSYSGVVNLYDSWQEQGGGATRRGPSSRTPLKSIMNLQSGIHSTCFNSDGQILAMATNKEKEGLRLIHVPTATVYSNWPTANTPLGYVWSMDFSPDSRFLALGNDKGKCLLYQLKHYVA